jgi:hypothetical protein
VRRDFWGNNKLWFYDEEPINAMFVWKEIAGWFVVSSTAEQRFTSELLHEQRPPATPDQTGPDEQAALERAREAPRAARTGAADVTRNVVTVRIRNLSETRA